MVGLSDLEGLLQPKQFYDSTKFSSVYLGSVQLSSFSMFSKYGNLYGTLPAAPTALLLLKRNYYRKVTSTSNIQQPLYF